MAFTTCQVPVIAHRSGPQKIEITRPDGSRHTIEALCLDEQTSAAYSSVLEEFAAWMFSMISRQAASL